MSQNTAKQLEYFRQCLSGILTAKHCLQQQQQNPNDIITCTHNDCDTYQKLAKHIIKCTKKICECAIGKRLLCHYNICVSRKKDEYCEICSYVDVGTKIEHSPEDKAKILNTIQIVLGRILHATKCLEENKKACNINCAKLIKLLDHTTNCDGDCIGNKHCKIIKKIYSHYVDCNRNNECVICDKYRNKENERIIVEPIAGPSNYKKKNNITVMKKSKNENIQDGSINNSFDNTSNIRTLSINDCNIENGSYTIQENLMNYDGELDELSCDNECQNDTINNSKLSVDPNCTDDANEQFERMTIEEDESSVNQSVSAVTSNYELNYNYVITSNENNIASITQQSQLQELAHKSNNSSTELNSISPQVINPQVIESGMLSNQLQQLSSEPEASNQKEIMLQKLWSGVMGNSELGIHFANLSNENNIATINLRSDQSKLPNNTNQLTTEVNSISNEVVNPQFNQNGVLSNQQEIFLQKLLSEPEALENRGIGSYYANSSNENNITTINESSQLSELTNNANELITEVNSLTNQVINHHVNQTGIVLNQQDIFLQHLIYETMGNTEFEYNLFSGNTSNEYNISNIISLSDIQELSHNTNESPTEVNSISTQVINPQINQMQQLASESAASNQHEIILQQLWSEVMENGEISLHFENISNENNIAATTNENAQLSELIQNINQSTTDINSLNTQVINPQVNQTEILSNQQKIPFNIFNHEELIKVLMPTLEKLIQEPFVDPKKIGIPDNFDIIKTAIDTIKHNLETGIYSDPWEYINDVWLIFENAFLYNRKTTKVYKHSIKLSEIFKNEIDSVMKKLGYCCGRKYTYNLCCSDRFCKIPIGSTYYSSDDKILLLCEKCYKSSSINKDELKEVKNDNLELEPFVHCNECGRKQHQICVLYLKNNCPNGFVCDYCMKTKGTKPKENKFSAKRLPNTKLGKSIETRVNDFLKMKEAGAGKVHIRVVSTSDKIAEVKPGMRRRFVESNELCGEFPYRAKVLFAFQEVDGVDVCFFGMHVQEYGSECPSPNTRRVYIAYLDSVHFFKPRQYRTAVYHEILLGYMDYVKKLGFTMAHIWACPPSKGDDYIFHCHPPGQEIPEAERLQKWYKKMLDKGVNEKTIQYYNNILKESRENKLISAANLPYFEGDFWPIILEKYIKNLEKDGEKKKKQSETAQNKKFDTVKAERRNKNKKDIEQRPEDVLCKKMFEKMEVCKGDFFVIRLHSTESAANLPPIQDPDPLINRDFMDGRNAFLTFTRDHNYEFSSLRRAQFTTLNMVYKLCNLRFKQCSMKLLVHASQCQDANCHQIKICTQMKDQINHIRKCPGKVTKSCNNCNILILLCRAHAEQCKLNICRVLYCAEIKAKLKKNQIQDQLYTYRRCGIMNNDDLPSSE